MKTAYEIAYKTFSEMDDFSQSIINQGLLVDCVRIGSYLVASVPCRDTPGVRTFLEPG